MWTLAFFDHRGRHDVLHKDCFRIKGGNQQLTDALAARLGNRIKLGCPMTRLKRGDSGVTEKMALAELKRFYPGKVGEVEKVVMKHWYLEKWAPRCERVPFQTGALSKFWPLIFQPEGRVHFVGSGVDNGTGGQEAATRSAHRTAIAIDQA